MKKQYRGIVVFGEMGSGKNFLANQIKEIHEDTGIFNIGDLCRDIMGRVSQVNGQWTGNERKLGQTIADKLREIDINLMNDYLYASLQSKVDSDKQDELSGHKESNNRLIIVTGGRTIADLTYWKNKGFLTVGVMTSEDNRKDRLLLRDNCGSITETHIHITEEEVRKIINDGLCDEIVDNNGSLKQLNDYIRCILDRHSFTYHD